MGNLNPALPIQGSLTLEESPSSLMSSGEGPEGSCACCSKICVRGEPCIGEVNVGSNSIEGVLSPLDTSRSGEKEES